MSFEIFVNNKPYDLWERATVKRDIGSNSGAFSFITSSPVPPVNKFPVVPGDLVYIRVDGDTKIFGYVDSLIASQNTDSHTIDVSGRDNTQDLIDSSVPDAAKVTQGGAISLKNLCIKFVQALEADIPVESNVTDLLDFTNAEIEAAEFGGTCMAELVSFARKRQVYLVSDGKGGLLIYRPNEKTRATGSLIHKINDPTNNVKSYSIKLSEQKRFYKYVCSSQDNLSAPPPILPSWLKEHPEDATESDGTNRTNSVIDKDIRKTRYLEIQAEESMSDTECGKRAAEEANLRRGLSQQYRCVVAGHSQPDGMVWDFGQFVNIVDEYAAISGELLIKSVSFFMDKRKGSTTTLMCVAPDTYQVTADPSATVKRRTRLASAFQSEGKSGRVPTSPRRANLASFYGVKIK